MEAVLRVDVAFLVEGPADEPDGDLGAERDRGVQRVGVPVVVAALLPAADVAVLARNVFVIPLQIGKVMQEAALPGIVVVAMNPRLLFESVGVRNRARAKPDGMRRVPFLEHGNVSVDVLAIRIAEERQRFVPQVITPHSLVVAHFLTNLLDCVALLGFANVRAAALFPGQHVDHHLDVVLAAQLHAPVAVDAVDRVEARFSHVDEQILKYFRVAGKMIPFAVAERQHERELLGERLEAPAS